MTFVNSSFDDRSPVAKYGKLAVAGLGLATALVLMRGTWYTVEPTHVAYLVRWNEVVTPHDKPIGPGLHVKLPLVERVDSISIATDSFMLPETHVFTRDSQLVDLQLGVTYRVPPTAAYHLLYEVGRAGNVDVARNLNQVMLDRTRTVISRHDIAQVAGPDRETVMQEIKAVNSDAVRSLFGVEIQDMQIAKFAPSKVYQDNIEKAVQARAMKLQAELDQQRAYVEATTAKIRADGESAARVAQAEGNKQQAILAAQAEAEKTRLSGEAQAGALLAQRRSEAEGIRLRGEAEALAIKAKIEAAGGPDKYVAQLGAEAQKNWNGSVPTMVLSADKSPLPIIPLTLPMQGR
jgi:modulator of FtsH protease HflC